MFYTYKVKYSKLVKMQKLNQNSNKLQFEKSIFIVPKVFS